MKKLRLNLEELSVETFDPEIAPEAARGTVRGYNTAQVCGHTPDGFCPYDTAECSVDTCDHTCGCQTFADCVPTDLTT